jgi:hypothetical protein
MQIRHLAACTVLASVASACGGRTEGSVTFDSGVSQPATSNAAGAGYRAGARFVGHAPFDAAAVTPCNAGCLCSSPNDCPMGCYVTATVGLDGAVSQPFCSNGIVRCGAGWSIGAPMDNCGVGQPTILDAGPDGAFCCSL